MGLTLLGAFMGQEAARDSSQTGHNTMASARAGRGFGTPGAEAGLQSLQTLLPPPPPPSEEAPAQRGDWAAHAQAPW